MKNIQTRASRVIALGVGLAMIGGFTLAAAAPAQAAGSYSISGTVNVDNGDGSPVPADGATVRDVNNTANSASTRADGTFTLSGLPNGDYRLDISKDGYATATTGGTIAGDDGTLPAVITLTAGAPAEEAPATYSIRGVVTAKDANPAFAPSVRLSGVNGSSDTVIRPDSAGNFEFSGLATDADLSIVVSADGYETVVRDVPITDADVTVPPIALLPNLPAGTVTISGTQAVGSTLTATPSGWPEGTTFNYQWGAVGPHAQNSGDLRDTNSSTLVVTEETVNKRIWVQAIGSKAGFADNGSDVFVADAPKLPTAAAPVADSTELAAYLAANDSTPQTQTSVSLPAGALDPTKSYTANVPFTGGDSFVDVYLYSSPISVGTFPVVNGVAKVTLSADVLSKLAAGSHTLVVVGQFSGAVSSVAISVSAVLATTGFNAGVPFGAAALLLVLGAALLLVRRRRMHA